MAHSIDMRGRLPGARNQGSRPTCLAFAMSDAHMVAAKRSELLSADYLHFHAARHAHVPLNDGVGLSNVVDALKTNGQPLEEECPYSDSRPDSWVPPSSVSAVWTRDSRLCKGLPSDALKMALQASQAHVLVLRISRSFFMPDPHVYIVTEDGSKDRRLHAVVIVGMVTPAQGDVAFLARNSWGSEWGQDGHAWLPLSYVDARATQIIEIEAERS
jgi:hypothetical protein